MISGLSSSNQQFIDNLRRVTDRMNNDQLQIASGSRMQQVSDAPDQVSELLQARASLSASQQITTNLGNVKSEVDMGEQTLESAVQLFDQVQTLAAQGATGTETASTRATLAQQLQSIEQQFVGFANTSIGGRYVFAGDSDQTAPYSYDVTQTPPVSTYLGATSSRVALHPNGTTFPVALTADQIFSSTDPTKNVFGAIDSLITALQNNDQAAAQAAQGGLAGVAQHLNNQLAFYGTTQNKIASALDFGASQQTSLKTEISSLQDADIAGTILDMTQMQTEQQAALTSRAQMPKSTLFDFMA